MVGMNSSPIQTYILGAIGSFAAAIWLWRFKVPVNPPASRAHLTVEQRQKRIKIASGLCVLGGCLMLALVAFLTWNEHQAFTTQ